MFLTQRCITEISALGRIKNVGSFLRGTWGQSARKKVNHCHRHCWSLRVQSRCPSVVGSPHFLTLCPTLCLTLRRAKQAGTRLLIQTDSSCSRCPTALNQIAAAPSSFSLDGHCRSRPRQIPQSYGGFQPHCRSGFYRHQSHCLMQFASCGRPLHLILNHCLVGVCG